MFIGSERIGALKAPMPVLQTLHVRWKYGNTPTRTDAGGKLTECRTYKKRTDVEVLPVSDLFKDSTSFLVGDATQVTGIFVQFTDFYWQQPLPVGNASFCAGNALFPPGRGR